MRNKNILIINPTNHKTVNLSKYFARIMIEITNATTGKINPGISNNIKVILVLFTIVTPKKNEAMARIFAYIGNTDNILPRFLFISSSK